MIRSTTAPLLALLAVAGCSSSGGSGDDLALADGRGPGLDGRVGDTTPRDMSHPAPDTLAVDGPSNDGLAMDSSAMHSLCPPGDPSLVLCLPLDDDPQAGKVTDHSGAGSHGTVVGAPTSVAGVQGQALRFSGGPAEHVVLPASGSPASSSVASVEAWIRLDAMPPGPVGVVDRGADAAAIILRADDGKPRVGCRGGVNSITETIALGSWTHVACVVAEPGHVQLFVDGVGGSSVLMVLSSASGCDLRIGASCYSYGERGFPGAIDGVRIHSRPLTREELCLAAGRGWDGSSCS